MNKIVIILLIFAYLLISCDKSDVEQDYRDKYVGNYFFKIKYSYPTYKWIDSLKFNIIVWNDSNYTYKGFVKRTDNISNRIFVDWGKDTLANINGVIFIQKNDLIVDSIGILCFPEYRGGGHTYFYPPSYIKNDTMRFGFGSGGLGAYSAWDVTGLKEK